MYNVTKHYSAIAYKNNQGKYTALRSRLLLMSKTVNQRRGGNRKKGIVIWLIKYFFRYLVNKITCNKNITSEQFWSIQRDFTLDA